MELAHQIRQKRKERGLSQEELAAAVYVTRQTVSNWENDKTYPDVQSLLLLSELFGMTIDELVKGDVPTMEKILSEDARRMNRLSYVMAGSVALALAAAAVASLFTDSVVVMIAVLVAFWVPGFVASVLVDRLKKKHDLVSYREIVDFCEGREVNRGAGRPRSFLRDHRLMGKALMALVTAAVAAVLMWCLMAGADAFSEML